MLYVRFPLSLRNVEDLLHERGVDVSYESVRYWWQRFGSQFASQIKAQTASPRVIAASQATHRQAGYRPQFPSRNQCAWQHL